MQLLKRERIVNSNQQFESVPDWKDSPKKRWCSEHSTRVSRVSLFADSELNYRRNYKLARIPGILTFFSCWFCLPLLPRCLIYGHQNHLMAPQNSHVILQLYFSLSVLQTVNINVTFTALKTCFLSGSFRGFCAEAVRTKRNNQKRSVKTKINPPAPPSQSMTSTLLRTSVLAKLVINRKHPPSPAVWSISHRFGAAPANCWHLHKRQSWTILIPHPQHRKHRGRRGFKDG